MLLGIAHAQAYQRICRSRRERAALQPGSISVFRPVSIWLEVCKLLPESRAVFLRGVIGISSLIMATAVIGLDVQSLQRDVALRLCETWLFSPKVITAARTNAVVAGPEIAQVPAVTDLENSSEPSEVTLNGLPRSGEEAPRCETGEFHIVGYLTNSQGEIRTLLLAIIEKNRGRFVGRISLEGVDSDRVRDLQELLDRNRVTLPLFKVGYQARWVRPAVVCDVAFAGWTNMGVLREGHLLDFR